MNLCGQFFRGIGPDFRQRRMVMRHHGQFVNRHAFGHRRNDFMNEFAAHGTNARAAEDFTGLRLRQQLHKAVLRFHDERFAVFIERITCRQI